MAFSVSSSYTKIRTLVDRSSNDALPPPSALLASIASLPANLPVTGLGDEATEAHLLEDISPGFNGPKTSANYYGFVTGGVLPIAEVADNLVTAFDQNVAVHLPDQSISTVVEDRATSMLLELLKLGDGWEGRTFTTGCTGANVMGLACGREAVVQKRLGRGESVAELGILAACAKAGVKEIQVLSSMGHSSLYKAASVVGLGRASVKDIPHTKDQPWKLDLAALETSLKQAENGIVSIVAVSAGEVNTGRFATDGLATMQRIRHLCDEYGAWLHVDGAFGIFARALPQTPEFASLQASAAGLELADSIASDAHKMLNVPYDCGFFLTKSLPILTAVFQNPNAAYLATGPSATPSPLNTTLENSRRFRALPVYASLLSLGAAGYAALFAAQVRLSRAVAAFLARHAHYELLAQDEGGGVDDVHIIVLFRARDERVNEALVGRINATRRMYVSGTKWQGRTACRMAVSTWRVEEARDEALVRAVLEEVLVG